MASSSLSLGKNVGFFHWGMHQMESKMASVKWVGGWGGKTSQIRKGQKGSCEEVEELNALEKTDGGFFSAIVVLCCADTLNWELRSDRCSASPAAGVSRRAKSQSVTQLFSWFV